jgi:CRP-like cAMP-binding protein
MPIRTELHTIADLEAGARVIPAGSYLYRQGDVCSTYFIVLGGWVALSVLVEDGACQILDFTLPGAVLGFQSAADAPMYHSACCLSVVRVYAFPRHKLDDIIEANPRLAVLLCRQVAADEARAHDHLTSIGLRDAKQRIAHLLLELYVRVRGHLPIEPGETIKLPLSQGQIGQALGLTYVHVCRTLQTLRQRGIVQFANHTLEIIDPAALMTAAGVKLEVLDRQPRVGQSPPVQLLRHQVASRETDSLPAGWMPLQNGGAAPIGMVTGFTPAKAA